MFVHVDPSNGIAIYDQIVRQVKFAVASEALKPGNLVPSVREMARDLTVNPNTVARAYRELQVDNVLQPLRGTGLEVTSAAYKKCRDDRAALIRSRLRSATRVVTKPDTITEMYAVLKTTIEAVCQRSGAPVTKPRAGRTPDYLFVGPPAPGLRRPPGVNDEASPLKAWSTLCDSKVILRTTPADNW